MQSALKLTRSFGIYGFEYLDWALSVGLPGFMEKGWIAEKCGWKGILEMIQSNLLFQTWSTVAVCYYFTKKKKKEVVNVRDCIIFRALLAFLNIFAYSCFVFDLNLFAVHINKFAIVL